MKYIVGLIIAILYLIFLQQFIPGIDPLSQGGFLLYSPVLLIIFVTFYSSKETKIRAAKEVPSTQLKEVNPIHFEVDTNTEELTPDFLHLISLKELPESVNSLSKYDPDKYSSLINDLSFFSIDTKNKLKDLIAECKEQVLLESEEKLFEIIEKTRDSIHHYQKEGNYISMEHYQDRLAELEKMQTSISNIGFFNLALKTKFKQPAFEYFNNKKNPSS